MNSGMEQVFVLMKQVEEHYLRRLVFCPTKQWIYYKTHPTWSYFKTSLHNKLILRCGLEFLVNVCNLCSQLPGELGMC